LGLHPEKAKNFAGTMSISLTGEGYDSRHVVEHGPWALIPHHGTVVDMGGSDGGLMVAIARAYPSLRCCVVQDLPAQIEKAPPLPQDVSDRVTLQSHDFFTPQPVMGAEVYLFRWIFHNWADKYCLRILENLIPALKPGSRIVLNEVCLPEPNIISNRWERRLR
jgi:hypothetical protein